MLNYKVQEKQKNTQNVSKLNSKIGCYDNTLLNLYIKITFIKKF